MAIPNLPTRLVLATLFPYACLVLTAFELIIVYVTTC
jgi:hypothetical protein